MRLFNHLRAERLWALFAALSSVPTMGQSYRQGPVTLSVRVTPEKPSVADRLRIELTLTAPRSAGAQLPESTGGVDCGDLLERTGPVKEPAGRDSVQSSEVFTVEPRNPGPCHIGAIQVRYGASTLRTEEITIHIASLISDPNDIDIRDPLRPLAYTPQDMSERIVRGTLGSIALIGVVMAIHRHRRRRTGCPTPDLLLRTRLVELSRCGTMTAPPLYSEIRQTFRCWLRECLRFDAAALTSQEITEGLRRRGLLSAETESNISGFLEALDLKIFRQSTDEDVNPRTLVQQCLEIMNALGARHASLPRMLRDTDA